MEVEGSAHATVSTIAWGTVTRNFVGLRSSLLSAAHGFEATDQLEPCWAQFEHSAIGGLGTERATIEHSTPAFEPIGVLGVGAHTDARSPGDTTAREYERVAWEESRVGLAVAVVAYLVAGLFFIGGACGICAIMGRVFSCYRVLCRICWHRRITRVDAELGNTDLATRALVVSDAVSVRLISAANNSEVEGKKKRRALRCGSGWHSETPPRGHPTGTHADRALGGQVSL